MAEVTFIPLVEKIKGEFGGAVMRKKKYRAPDGAIICEGVQESYTVANPRDFKKTPPQGAEAANMRSFGDASLQASQIIRAGKLTEEELAAMSAEERAHMEELRAQLEEFRLRFTAQLKKPDPEAPFEKELQPGSAKLRQKQYIKFDNFIQAILRARKG